MIASDNWVDTEGVEETAEYRPKMEELIADMKRFIEAQEGGGN